MPSMSLTTSQDVFAAVTNLPLGAALVIHDFRWEDYEQLLEVIGERPSLRLNYDSGRLEIVSPLPEHKSCGKVIDLVLYVFSDVHGLSFQSYGTATWKSKELGKGVEPDACYYVKNAARVIGEKKIRLGTHPPPDVCVEIDITNSSIKKLSIYAALSVPEIWRYDGRAFTFYTLSGGKYSAIPESRQLPGLTGPMLVQVIEDCENRGQMIALKAFRRRLRASKR